MSCQLPHDGLLELDALREAVSERTLMVSVMLANNEIGVVQPIAEIAAISHAVGAYVHTDGDTGRWTHVGRRGGP